MSRCRLREVGGLWPLVLTLGVLLLMAVPPSARAHVQVLPGEVAPRDPVLFTVLVPGETESGTVKVELKVPPGVFPFSYEETPGWDRRVLTRPDGLADRIVWSGRARPDGLVRFNFLAGTPGREGELSWKAIQTYADGEEAAWIGPPESENPAAVTVVSEDAPRQNAGGEGVEAAGDSGQATSSEVTGSGGGEDGSGNLAAEVMAGIALLLGAAALVLAIRSRSSRTRRTGG